MIYKTMVDLTPMIFNIYYLLQNFVLLRKMRFNNDVRHQAAKELAIRYINSKWRYDK